MQLGIEPGPPAGGAGWDLNPVGLAPTPGPGPRFWPISWAGALQALPQAAPEPGEQPGEQAPRVAWASQGTALCLGFPSPTHSQHKEVLKSLGWHIPTSVGGQHHGPAFQLSSGGGEGEGHNEGHQSQRQGTLEGWQGMRGWCYHGGSLVPPSPFRPR